MIVCILCLIGAIINYEYLPNSVPSRLISLIFVDISIKEMFWSDK